MKRLLRWLGYGLAGLVAVALVLGGWIWFASSREIGRVHAAVPEPLPAASPAQLADGPRQGLILGCVSCHGEGLRGEKMIDSPVVGTLWAPNLTEVAARSTDAQLARAIRHGIGTDGRPLWIMPSGPYSRMSDGEVAALVAWIRSLPRAGERSPRISPGPLGRFGIATGAVEPSPATIEEYRVREPYGVGPAHAAGRRIAAIACSGCHGADLGGGHVASQDTPGLSIAAAYDPAQFTTLLRTGRPPSGRDLGLMAEVARDDLRHLTDAEIAQLHAYLRARAERVTDPALER
jgi:mono/diheme cytochrome c family protein